MSEQPRPKVYGGEEHPELNVQRCTWQINEVSRISGITKRRLERVFIQGQGMKPGVNWILFYDAFMAYVEEKGTQAVNPIKARNLTDGCVGDNGHFISPDGKTRGADREEPSEPRSYRFRTRF